MSAFQYQILYSPINPLELHSQKITHVTRTSWQSSNERLRNKNLNNNHGNIDIVIFHDGTNLDILSKICFMIKITYPPVPADCAEDPGLLLDDFLVSCVLNVRYRSRPFYDLLNCIFVSVLPLSGLLLLSGAEMPHYGWFGPSSSVPNRILIYWTKQQMKSWRPFYVPQ